MRPEVEQFLAQVRESLHLPAKKADLLVEELRSHVLADYEERVKAGKSEDEAAREAIQEVGDAGELARVWRAEHAEARFSPIARNVAAAMLSMVGFFAAMFIPDIWKMQISPEGATWWQAPITNAGWWIWQHTTATTRETIVSVLPMLLAGLIVGRVSRRRGWLLVLAPWVFFWGTNWLSDAHYGFVSMLRGHLMEGGVQGAALLLGAYFGRRMGPWPTRLARVAFLALCVVGLSAAADGFVPAAVGVSAYAAAVGVLALGVMLAWRRFRAKPDKLTIA